MAATAVVTREQRLQEIAYRKAFNLEVSLMGIRRIEAMAKVRITRELVLEGKDHRSEVPVPEWGEEAFLMVRPITDGEFVKVQQTILRNMSASDLQEIKGDAESPDLSKIKMDIVDLVDREKAGKYLAVSFGLSCDGEEWTAEAVGKLPPGVPDRIYNAVALASGFPRLAGSSEKAEVPG